MLTIHRQTVMMHPILDKYYERDPYHVRSSAFVQAKGLVSNEKAPTSGSISPSNDPQGGFDNYRKLVGCAGNRSLSPDLARRSLTPNPRQEIVITPQRNSTAASIPRKPLPVQGNIQVKRHSALLADVAGSARSLSDDQNSDTELKTSDVRNPRKLSRFFPELTLTNNTS